jgi:hypothetical protein
VGEWPEANEPGILYYTVFRGSDNENVVRIVEAHMDEKYLRDPHKTSKIMLGNTVAQGDTRIGRDLIFSKVAGYFQK